MDTLYETIFLRRGTAAEWVAAAPTLHAGEPGFETDTLMLKVGDGVSAWAILPYLTPYAYKRTMAGDEALPYLSRMMVCSIDPDGVDRVLTISALFPAGSILLITNKGANAITLTDGGSFSEDLGGGAKEFYVFDGTTWG